VVAMQPAARRSSATQTIATALAAFALVAVATRVGFSSQDSLLQTAMPIPGQAQINMARSAPQMMQQMPAQQPVMYAKAVPVQGVQQPQLAVMAQPMPGQMLQDEAAAAPPVEAAAPAVAGEVAPAVAGEVAPAVAGEVANPVAEVESGVAGAATVVAGTGPGAAAMNVPAAAACANPCPNAECSMNAGMGCYEVSGQPPGPTSWECQCPPPPPPPVVGSGEWINAEEQQIADPGAEAAEVGPNLAMYESGKIAVNLNAYLHASAERTKTQAAIENLIYKDLAAVSKANGGEAEESAEEATTGKEAEGEDKDEAWYSKIMAGKSPM